MNENHLKMCENIIINDNKNNKIKMQEIIINNNKGTQPEWISLTLFHHLSLSSIAPGRSSRLHPMSVHIIIIK